MKKTTLIKVWMALEEMKYRIEVPAAVSQRARGAIEKMIQI